MKIETQVSVPLPMRLRAYIERRAEREGRSLAAIVRRLVAEAARREGEQEAA